MPQFEAYLMVDWSASSTRSRGADSIWYCLLSRRGGKLTVDALENPSTRYQAGRELKEVLCRSAECNQRILVGFDFPFGYPAGFAAALNLTEAPAWKATWREIVSGVVDRTDNTNNRFAVAARFNERISGLAYPFWGCPTSCTSLYLTAKKGGSGQLSERRTTDVGAMQPIWKLYGNGCVGSQALLGIPVVAALRNDPLLKGVSQVWPFETGLQTPAAWRNPERLIVFAEIYPSLVRVQPADGEVKDAAQVRTIATCFAALDETQDLGALFTGRANLTGADRDRVENEEGWTLGVGLSHLEQLAGVVDIGGGIVEKGRSASKPSRSRPSSAGRTTKPGYENGNGQVTIRCTGLPGTDHCQYIYVLRCGSCGHQYGANGTDIHIRRCPACQGGLAGLPY